VDTTRHQPSRQDSLLRIDLSGAQDGAFPQARRAVDFAITFLARGDSTAAQSLREKLEPRLKKFSTWNYSSLSSAEREDLLEGLAKYRSTGEATACSRSLSFRGEYDGRFHAWWSHVN